MVTKQLSPGWKEIELGNEKFFKIIGSGIKKFDGERSYLSTESIKENKIKKIECEITFSNRPSRANMEPTINSVWFAKMKDTLKVYSFTNSNKEEVSKYILSTGFVGIEINKDLISTKYLEYIFKSREFNKKKNLLCSGATQKAINNSNIKKIKLSLPSLYQQGEIVKILEKAEELKNLRKQSDNLTNSYLKNLFYNLFGDPIKNDKKWDVFFFSEVGKLARGKSKHRPRNDPKLLGGRYPLIQTGDVVNSNGYIKKYTQTYSDLGLKQSKLWPKETLCITIAANIAKTGILSFESCFPDSVVGFTPNNKVKTEYVQYWLSFLEKYLESKATKTAQKNINLEILSKLKIPIPTLKLQEHFVKTVKQVEKLKEYQEQSNQEINNLFNTLMQKAFRGEL